MAKVDREVLRQIFTQAEGMSDFVRRCQADKKTKASKSYLTSFYYKFKNENKSSLAGDDSDRSEQQQQTQPVTEPPGVAKPSESVTGTAEVLDDSSVKVESGEVLAEGSDIRNIYKEMLKEEVAKDPSSKDSLFQNTSARPQQNTTSSEGFSPMGGILSEAIIAINSDLLYGGACLVGNRPLFEHEQSRIRQVTKPIDDKIAGDLSNQPELGAIVFGGLLPAVSRLDLWINYLMNNFKTPTNNFTMSQPSPGPAQYQQQQTQNTNPQPVAPQPTSQPETTVNPAWQAQLQSWREMGFQVDPSYDVNGMIDSIAYVDNHVVRNFGSTFGTGKPVI